jgi:hypothetical protein
MEEKWTFEIHKKAPCITRDIKMEWWRIELTEPEGKGGKKTSEI